jgi:anthranilate 1,2-dioxygenase small subunit
MSSAIDIKSRNPDSREARIERVLLRAEIEEFNVAYAAALDDQRLTDWSEMFSEDASYVVLSRENHDRGMPVGLIYCENRGMIRDRAFALAKTVMFAPRYLRHFVSNTRVVGINPDGSISARANYLLLQVLLDRPDATLHQVGVYHDVFRNSADGLKLAKRHCVYDNLLVPNALCLPV